jgi:hypothetical protein
MDKTLDIYISDERELGVGSWELGVGEEVVVQLIELIENSFPSPQSPVPSPQSLKLLIKICVLNAQQLTTQFNN